MSPGLTWIWLSSCASICLAYSSRSAAQNCACTGRHNLKPKEGLESAHCTSAPSMQCNMPQTVRCLTLYLQPIDVMPATHVQERSYLTLDRAADVPLDMERESSSSKGDEVNAGCRKIAQYAILIRHTHDSSPCPGGSVLVCSRVL